MISIQKFESNDENDTHQFEIELIDNIITYSSYFVSESSNKFNYFYSQHTEKISILSSQICIFLYKYLFHLAALTKNYLANSISKSLYRMIEYLVNNEDNNLIESDIEYFINLIFQLTEFTQNDYELISDSKVNFFYDFYDIDFNKFDMYSSKQSVSFTIKEYTTVSKKSDIIGHIAAFLMTREPSQMNENHYLMLALLNHIIQSLDDEFDFDIEILASMLELINQYLNLSPEIIIKYL